MPCTDAYTPAALHVEHHGCGEQVVAPGPHLAHLQREAAQPCPLVAVAHVGAKAAQRPPPHDGVACLQARRGGGEGGGLEEHRQVVVAVSTQRNRSSTVAWARRQYSWKQRHYHMLGHMTQRVVLLCRTGTAQLHCCSGRTWQEALLQDGCCPPSHTHPGTHPLADDAVLGGVVCIRPKLDGGVGQAIADGHPGQVDVRPSAQLLGTVDVAGHRGGVVALGRAGRQGREAQVSAGPVQLCRIPALATCPLQGCLRHGSSCRDQHPLHNTP